MQHVDFLQSPISDPRLESPLAVRPQRSRLPATPPSAGALVRSLRRRWLPAVCVGLLLAAAAAFTARQVLPAGKHTARAQLYVSANAPKVMFDTKEAKAEFGNYLKSQMAMVRSRPVLKSALARPEVAALGLVQMEDDPLEWLEAKLQVDTAVSPEILRISLTGDQPGELTVLVDAVTQVYLQEVVNKEHNERLGKLRQLEEISKKYEDQIREYRTKRKSLAEKMGTGDPQALAIRERLIAERLAAPEKELLQVQSELRRLQVEAAALKVDGVNLQPSVPEAEIDALIDRDPGVTQAQARLSQAEANLDRVRKVVDRELSDPVFSRYRTEIDAAKSALAERRQTVRTLAVNQLKERAKLDAKANADQLDRRIAQLKDLERDLTREVNRVAEELKQLNQSGTALEAFKEQISELEDLTKKLTLEREQRTVEIQAPPRVSLWEEAVVTQADNEKRRLVAAGLAGIGALAFVLFAFAWWEFQAKRIAAVDDVINGLGMRVLGVLPPWNGRRGLVRPSTRSVESHGHGPFIESVDAVRTMVVHTAHVDARRVLMVTSAVQGEGKTLLASHLAARLAASGRRTLLIDGDLRKPAVHQLFGLPGKPGLAELLRGETTPEAVTQPLGDGTLEVIAAGNFDNQASQALAQGRFHAIVEELRDRYDLIVIDSSPILPVPDGLLIGQQVEGVIFSVLRDVSRIPKVNAAVQRLEALGVPVLGAVVSGGGGEGDGAVYP